MQLRVALADQAAGILQMLNRSLISTMQGEKFGPCPMYADDVSSETRHLSKVVPHIDITLVHPALPQENRFSLSEPP